MAFQIIGTPYPVVLALWVGIISQFLPVVGTYLSGVLPVLLAFLDSPVRALAVLVVIAVYQQLENFLLAPRITAHTLEIHPAVAFGSAIAGVLPEANASMSLSALSRHCDSPVNCDNRKLFDQESAGM